MTLAHLWVAHPRAVERDLLINGYHLTDIGTRITWSEFASLILAAPGTSAITWAASDGWSKTDHLLASLSEQEAGVMSLNGRYIRPGVKAEDAAPLPPAKPHMLSNERPFNDIQMDVMTPEKLKDELAERRKTRHREDRTIS